MVVVSFVSARWLCIREKVLIMEVPALLGLRLPVGVGHLQIVIAVPIRLTDALLFVLFVRGLTVDTILLSARIS